jgi:hypothetical protein
VHALLHSPRQLLLAVCQQRFDLVVRVIADGVDLCRERLARERGIVVEEHLNPVVVLLEQWLDLPPLVKGKFQILGQMIQFLVDRPWAVGSLKHLTRPLEWRRRLLAGGYAIGAQCPHQD